MKLVTRMLDKFTDGGYSKFIEATSRAALVGTSGDADGRDEGIESAG